MKGRNRQVTSKFWDFKCAFMETQLKFLAETSPRIKAVLFISVIPIYPLATDNAINKVMSSDHTSEVLSAW